VDRYRADSRITNGLSGALLSLGLASRCAEEVLASYVRMRCFSDGGSRQQRVALDPSLIVSFPSKADNARPGSSEPIPAATIQ